MKASTLLSIALASLCLAEPTHGHHKRPAHHKRQSLPTVDLGYVTQQASSYNETGHYYVFKNVRYAAPPTGERRFQPPEKPLQESGVVDGGLLNNTVCHQFIPPNFPLIPGVPPEGIEMGSEDCLFIDVYVPEEVLENKETAKAPVLGWWSGGSWVLGAKDNPMFGGEPSALLEVASAAGQPIVFVSSNYRIGAFGWLAEPIEEGVVPNAGLYDVLESMHWVNEHIGAFGGDSEKFTALGESSGGALVTHALTSFGGGGEPLPISQAIIQSPGKTPEDNTRTGRNDLYEMFLSGANCTTFSCLKEAPSSVLMESNRQVSFPGLAGTLGSSLGPIVDGEGGIVPDYNQNLLRDGKFHKGIRVLAQTARFEGRAFVIDNNSTGTDLLVSTIQGVIPDASNATIERIAELYPDDGTAKGYYNRAADFYGDYVYSCSARWTADAYSSSPSSGVDSESKSWRYVFNVAGSMHGVDIPYTFSTAPHSNDSFAWQQQALIDFVIGGAPGPAQAWTEYGSSYGNGKQATWLNETAIGTSFDPWGVGYEIADERCGFFLERRQFE